MHHRRSECHIAIGTWQNGLPVVSVQVRCGCWRCCVRPSWLCCRLDLFLPRIVRMHIEIPKHARLLHRIPRSVGFSEYANSPTNDENDCAVCSQLRWHFWTRLEPADAPVSAANMWDSNGVPAFARKVDDDCACSLRMVWTTARCNIVVGRDVCKAEKLEFLTK